MAEYEKIDKLLRVGQVFTMAGAGERKRKEDLDFAENESRGDGERIDYIRDIFDDHAEEKIKRYHESLNSEYEKQCSEIIHRKYNDDVKIGHIEGDTIYFEYDWRYNRRDVVENIMAGKIIPQTALANKNNYWDNMTISGLKESYPRTSEAVLEEFLDSVRHNSSYPPDASQKYLQGINYKYPKEMLADNKYFAVIAEAEYFHSGYAETDELMHMHQMSDFNEITAESESVITDKTKIMSYFYKEIMQDYINEFKSDNPAFKDVELPLPKSLILPQNKDVTHDGEAAACIREHTVQATNFRLMKEQYVKKPDYFVITHRIDKADDTASYKFRKLNTSNLEEASNMFDNIVASGELELQLPNTQKNYSKTQELLSAKDLKLEIEKSLSDFKSQQREYYAKWEEWRGAKEEWIDLALEEDNLSQRAEWSIEACQKQVRTAVQQTINAGIDKAATIYSAREIYAALQPALDTDGYYLSGAAKKLMGFDVENEYPVEDNLHYFEAMNGFGRLRFLEAAKFGERCFTPIQSGTETIDKYIIHSDTPQFKAYQDSTFTEALSAIKRAASLTGDMNDCLSAVANLKNVGTVELISNVSPSNGWVSIGEHMKSYALHYVDDEQRYNENYKMPTSTDYRMYETFHQPDDKIPTEPAFDISLPQETRTDKLLNLFRPERETPRLQTELKILTNNTNAMRNFVKLLDKSILEMKGEIAEVQGHAVKAAQEIQSGKHFNEWIQLNLKPELKAIGLDSEKTGFKELMNKLSQNVAASPHAQEEALAIE